MLQKNDFYNLPLNCLRKKKNNKLWSTIYEKQCIPGVIWNTQQ